MQKLNNEVVIEDTTIKNYKKEIDKMMYLFAIGALLSLIICGVAIRVINNKR